MDLRQLAAGLLPHELGERGLAAAVAGLGERSPVPVDAVVRAGRLPDRLEATIFFVCSEALANVAKHARASRVWVSIEERGDVVTVEIRDDGRGGAEPRSIADRVEAVGGTLRVDSPVGGGTRLRARIPCGADALIAEAREVHLSWRPPQPRPPDVPREPPP